MRPHPSPRIRLEQYTTPAAIATDILFLAAFVYQDIVGRTVVDLGTGTGRLAIGAASLGASQITAIDIDPVAIEVARENAETAMADIDWIVGDLEAIQGEFDTVIMNPPFGTKQRHLDKVFLGKAIRTGRVVYSLHKSTTREHISRFLRRHGCKVHAIHEYTLEIPLMFEHHKKRKYPVKVDCYRVETKGGAQQPDAPSIVPAYIRPSSLWNEASVELTSTSKDP